jgi:hypothetical protein
VFSIKVAEGDWDSANRWAAIVLVVNDDRAMVPRDERER